MEADWLKGGGQKDDWTGVRMSVLRLKVCESGSNLKNRPAT